MKTDRFLTAILVGIGVIVVAALVLFFLRRGETGYVAEDNPAGVVQNYALALYNRDYETAYNYLSSINKPTFDEFRVGFLPFQTNLTDTSLEVLDTELNGDNATVTLSIVRGGGPFSEPYREGNFALLTLEGGQWKITQMPYPFWNGYPTKPVEPVVIPTATLILPTATP